VYMYPTDVAPKFCLGSCVLCTIHPMIHPSTMRPICWTIHSLVFHRVGPNVRRYSGTFVLFIERYSGDIQVAVNII
jgi:hypothetical protein